MKATYEDLPWNFEAFRRFITYEALQQAAATLHLFDGELLFTNPALMEEFSRKTDIRTGLEWLPERRVSEGVKFNVEGNLFRNKARVFTSFYIVDPTCLRENTALKVTEFGRALALGYISKEEFYKQIFSRYEYPHPAYDDNWEKWTSAGIRLKPLAFFLRILFELYKLDEVGSVSTKEFAQFAHPYPDMKKAEGIAKRILENRRSGRLIERVRSDMVERKINDILAFMCISQYAYFDGPNYYINLMDVQREEGTLFWKARLGQDRATEIGQFLDEIGE